MTTRLETGKVASRYARALFEGALATQSLQAVHNDLTTLGAMLSQVPELSAFLENPTIPLAEKQAFLNERFSTQLHEQTFRLLSLMVENDRPECLSAVVEAFQTLLNTHENTITAEIITAIPLDKDLAKRLQETLATVYGYKKVDLDTRVDSDILGGVVVKIGDRLIDGSFTGQLHQLMSAMA